MVKAEIKIEIVETDEDAMEQALDLIVQQIKEGFREGQNSRDGNCRYEYRVHKDERDWFD